jgi:hypothetical protein
MGLEWLLEDDRWKQVGGKHERIDDFLTTIDMSQFKIAVDKRKKLVKRLEDMQATQRATAAALGVTHTTVQRDLGTSVPKEAEKAVKKADSGTSVPTPSDRPNPMTAVSGGEAARVVEKQVTKAHDKAVLYGHNEGDEWYTPKWLFDALGIHFSIDVCSPMDLAHVTTPADKHFNENDNGLTQSWIGTIWCNPPYSEPESWALKCIEHGNGLLLTHIPMNAGWCIDVWNTCDGIRLFQAMEFVRPDGSTQRPGTWLQLAAWGKKATQALARMKAPEDVAENPRRTPSPMWVKYA